MLLVIFGCRKVIEEKRSESEENNNPSFVSPGFSSSKSGRNGIAWLGFVANRLISTHLAGVDFMYTEFTLLRKKLYFRHSKSSVFIQFNHYTWAGNGNFI